MPIRGNTTVLPDGEKINLPLNRTVKPDLMGEIITAKVDHG